MQLTKEQTDRFEEYIEKWKKIGLDTGETDFEAAKGFIKQIYKIIDEPEPEQFYLVDSPQACVELDAKLSGLDRKDCLDNMCYGCHDAAWLSFYDYFKEVCGVEECKKLDGLFGLAKVAGWWSGREKYAIVCKKPVEIHLDENNRLHNESGMALRHVDGTGVWAIDGLNVTEQIVMRPETLTVDQIDGENNVEIRTIMLERYGWPQYLKNSNAKLLDKRHNDVENTKEALYQARSDHRLVVTCPTGRMFALGVPNTVSSCEDAQKWLGGNRKFRVIGRT